MQMLSDDDRNLVNLTDEELHAAWDLWFDLAQSTNDDDPPYTHGVFVNVRWDGTTTPAKTTQTPEVDC